MPHVAHVTMCVFVECHDRPGYNVSYLLIVCTVKIK